MNLRLIAINVADSRTIKVKFSSNLNPNISALNVKVEGVNDSTPDALVRFASVAGNVLTIGILPLTPFLKYRVTLSSVPGRPFNSEDGKDYLVEDGVENVRDVLGAENPNNIYRDNMVSRLSGQPYAPDKGTNIRTIFNALSEGFLRLKHDIRQSKNDNYLSFYVVDERKQRSFGPFDRLNEEGAFQVFRVGLTPQEQKIAGKYSYDYFPSDIISLQGTSVVNEQLEAGQGPGTFDRFIFTVEKYPVIKLNSLKILYQNGDTFDYDIRFYGYQINDPKYDTDFASTLLTLKDNQIKINEDILNDPDFKIPEGGDVVSIDYDYKSLGKFIDEDSVEVSQVLDSTREATPALSNDFSLSYAPITDSNGDIPLTGGIQFLNPISNCPFSEPHPAFSTELPYRAEALPRNPGEYSVDYETGRVFVFGADEDNDGTGYFPPGATYKYKNVFRRDLDYTYRAETSELVANPLRDLIGQTANITYLYEQTLVEGIDYKLGIHHEVLSERINNNLISANSLRTQNAPITNVFRIFNETTGEVYRLNRFLNDRIIFSSNTPPAIETATFERAAFHEVFNEQLILDREFVNISGVRIFKILLQNNNIISATEDVIGSSYNSSVSFSRNDIFSTELFYEGQIISEDDNTDKLGIGDYQIDYRNGVVYVGVTNAKDFALGTVNYRRPVINPDNPHVIAVSDIYHSVNPTFGVSKRINYLSFDDDEIIPSTFDVSDERFLNGDTSLPYLVTAAGTIIVQDDIKTVRNVFDNQDLLSSENPINFGETATSSANIIILDPEGVQQTVVTTVGPGLVITVPTSSSGISLNNAISVVRVSDSIELLDGYEVISGNTITLSASSGAVAGDTVEVIHTVKLNTSATPVVDYDRGEYFIDYTYLADEIIVSYEYGDNSLDFRESTTLDVGQEYYVNYRVGALRDSLLENFGSLMEIPELNSFNVDLERERYRDALIGALQSFTRGPTNPSMKDMIAEVTKIQPEIIEAAFQYWSLGISPLYQNEFKIDCSIVDRVFVPGVFDSGFLPTQPGDFISFPVSSNLRLNEGTMELAVIPEWDGLDNDATVTFKDLKRDGYQIPPHKIFIGSSSYNPEIVDGQFSITRFDNVVGLPSTVFTETGVFIFYDDQIKRWQILAKDTADGYQFSGEILSSGEVYDVKPIPGVSDLDDIIRSTQEKINFVFHLNAQDGYSPDGYSPDGYIPGYSFDGLTFMADSLHYFFDFAETESTNRFSLYKDGRGYLNFAVWDKGGGYALNPNRRSKYVVSADIQHWETGEKHDIGISWKLDTKDRMDEMHLFVDGFEVPNIIRYGGIPAASSSDRFRTVDPEVLAGTVPKNAVAGTCSTEAGSNTVVANGVDFGFEGIVPGDTIQIKEDGFSTYTILTVNGPTLELDSTMPGTLGDARFTVNPYSVVVSSEIDIYKNIAVSTILDGYENEIPGLRADIPGYSISKNAFNQNVLTIEGSVKAGSQIAIRTLGLNHRRCREKVYLWNDQSVLKTKLPPPINLDEVVIRSVLQPYIVIGPDNSTISGGNFEATLNPTETSNDTEGRTLEVRVSGGNVDFNTPTTITINGTSTGGVVEVLSFSEPGKQTTVNKWQTITSVDVVTTPITTSRNGAGVEIKEANSITTPNGNNIYPVIRFGFQTQSGLSLEGDGSDIVTDSLGFFPSSTVGEILVIESPALAAGSYKIVEKIDNNTVRLETPVGSSFTDGRYKIFDISIGRSGFQNGFFFIEQAGTVNTPYELPAGYYEFDYSAYLEVPFDPVGELDAFIGSDFNGLNQANAIIDEFRVLSTQMTDTRVGESIGVNEESITTGAYKINPFEKNPQTLVLLHMDGDVQNDADYYTFAERYFLQSSTSVNDNFGQSICFDEKGLGFNNNGRLTTATEGTIEFWVSPMFDTFNDPVPRVYFDASASVVEEVVSSTKGTVKASGRISQVLSVRLATDVTQNGTDYFIGGSLEDDFQTISLGTALPFQQTPVVITYIPSGVTGDRLTILKDREGFITFNVRASGQDYSVRQPVFWSRDTWHRVKATFLFNTANNRDQIRLWVDGEERGLIRFGSEGIVFGDGFTFGATTSGVVSQILTDNMDLQDEITRFYIGQDYQGAYPAKARMDNFRLSNKALNGVIIAGQPVDVNYSTNPDCVYPVIENAYTTMLLDFNQVIEKVEDFALLRDATFGIFNFTINVIDSFRIVEQSARVQAMLEAMIYTLKPATSKVHINYVR